MLLLLSHHLLGHRGFLVDVRLFVLDMALSHLRRPFGSAVVTARPCLGLMAHTRFI